ncbi:MAG: PKD domain-containing protein, partial [Flavobacteriales bacterium]|nr:PKD domain-containing protein [Flavobacteriales bacterium]
SWYWDFGDGTTSTLENPSHTYTSAGLFDVMLVATSLTGNCSDTVLFANYVSTSSPIADFTSTVVFSCAPMVANFTDVSNDAVSWSWDFGDGAVSTTQNPLHVYTYPGYYDVILTVTDVNGCSHVKTVPNAIFVPGPIADFSVSQTVFCDSGMAYFTDLSTGVNAWSWTFGDGYSSTLQDPSHSYDQSGIYSIVLILQDTMGCITSMVVDSLVSVYNTPTANFLLSDTVGCVAFNVAPSNLSTDYDAVYWDMGDGNQYTSTPAFHTYTTAGTFPITLIASNGNACFDTASRFITSIDVADATINAIGDICAQTGTILLTAAQTGGVWSGTGIVDAVTGEFDPIVAGTGAHSIQYEFSGLCGDIDSIQINVFPGVDATIQPIGVICSSEPAFNLSSPGGEVWSGPGIVDPITGLFDPAISGIGSFTIVHSVTNGVCSDQDIIVVQVDLQLDASFSSVQPLCDNLGNQFPIAVNAGGIWSGTGIINSVTGEFDPIIAGPGIHEVMYSMAGACGDTTTSTIVVYETPEADVASNITIGCTNHEVQFFGNASVASNFNWDFGPLGTSDDQNPSITFGPGTYDVQLIVTSADGCADTMSVNSMITVHDSIPSETVLHRVSVLSDSSVIIEWGESMDVAFEHYTLFRKNLITGIFDAIDVINSSSVTSYVDAGLNTVDSSYCYIIVEADVCGNQIDIADANEHCTINVSAEFAGIHHTDVSWTPYVGANITNYKLYRSVDGDTLELIATLTPSILSYSDPTSFCNVEYNYKVKATNIGGNGLISWSDTARVIGEGIQDLQFSNIIRATVLNDESVWIEWTVPSVASNFIENYNILRSTDTINFTSIAIVGVNDNSFEDIDVNVMEERYFYKIEVVNKCNAANKVGEVGTSILLQSKKISETKGILYWSAYEGWKEGVDVYQIQMLNEFNQWVPVKTVMGNVLQSTVDF